MASRRDFLEATVLAALPLVARAQPGMTAAPAATYSPELVLLEAGSPEARQFGARLAGRGARPHAVPPKDPAPLWFESVQPLWNRRPAPVAGLTPLSTLFCFEQLAWGHGLRVVFHAEHMLRDDGTATHRVLRGAVPALAEATPGAATPWPLLFADALAALRPRLDEPRPGPSMAGLEPVVPPGARLLASWLLA